MTFETWHLHIKWRASDENAGKKHPIMEVRKINIFVFLINFDYYFVIGFISSASYVLYAYGR